VDGLGRRLRVRNNPAVSRRTARNSRADLGETDRRLVLDFNFAYNPSRAYDPRWVCPLTPPQNRLDFAVRAGERV
jgi:uncharacterized protein (DUF1684 family)